MRLRHCREICPIQRMSFEARAYHLPSRFRPKAFQLLRLHDGPAKSTVRNPTCINPQDAATGCDKTQNLSSTIGYVRWLPTGQKANGVLLRVS